MVKSALTRLMHVAGAKSLSVVQIRDLLGITYQAARKIHDGGGISIETAQRFAEKQPNVDAQWLATGKAANPSPPQVSGVAEPVAPYLVAAGRPSLAQAVEAVAMAISPADPATRELAAGLLAGLARSPENHARVALGLLAMLNNDNAPPDETLGGARSRKVA